MLDCERDYQLGVVVGAAAGFGANEIYHRKQQALPWKMAAAKTSYGMPLVKGQVKDEVERTMGDLETRPGSVKRRPIDSLFIADAAKKASPGVVAIQIEGEALLGLFPQVAFGSGFILEESGVILTNAHVVQLAQKSREGIIVTLPDGNSYQAELLAWDQLSDLALIKIVNTQRSSFPCVELASSSELVPGEWVVAIGSPLTLQNSISCGVVSNVEREDFELGMQSRMSYIQTDAPITMGNSGGPLVNAEGKVVGINCMTTGLASNIGFAIPIDTAKEVVRELKEHGQVIRPYIGVSMLGLNAQLVREVRMRGYLGVPENLDHGVMIVHVSRGSPASRAGLEPESIIVEMNGKPIRSPTEVIKNLPKPGQPAIFKTLTVRNGRVKEKTLEIVPEPMPEATHADPRRFFHFGHK